MDKITEHKIVPKGWGYEKIVWNESYCGKILHFYKGKKLSYHFHLKKDEFFYLLGGRILLRVSLEDDISEAEEHILEPGDGFHIPTGLRHQMEGLEESDLLEFSTHDEPEDSIRIIKGD